jgi:hypothetical protein
MNTTHQVDLEHAEAQLEPAPKLNYDLTISNVEAWRKERPLSEVWSARRTRIWNQMRTSGERAVRKPDTYATRWKKIGDRIGYTAMALAMMLFLEVAFQVINAFVSGRVQAVIDQIRSSY